MLSTFHTNRIDSMNCHICHLAYSRPVWALFSCIYFGSWGTVHA